MARRCRAGSLSWLVCVITLWASPAISEEMRHQGIYFRAALGGSYLNDTIGDEADTATNYLGGGIGYTAWVAGSVIRGMVVGGGVTGSTIFAGTLEQAPGSFGSTFLITGAMWDYYVIPSQGFHLLVSAGLSLLDVEDQSGLLGGGGLAGAGFDWTVGEKSSVGVVGQLAYGLLSKDGVTHHVLAPTVQAAFTYY